MINFILEVDQVMINRIYFLTLFVFSGVKSRDKYFIGNFKNKTKALIFVGSFILIYFIKSHNYDQRHPITCIFCISSLILPREVFGVLI